MLWIILIAPSPRSSTAGGTGCWGFVADAADTFETVSFETFHVR